MIASTPQYITDPTGNKISIILPIRDYERMIEELEELEDIRLYDEAKREDTGEYMLFSDYLKNRRKNA